jgi:hypothetical protein
MLGALSARASCAAGDPSAEMHLTVSPALGPTRRPLGRGSPGPGIGSPRDPAPNAPAHRRGEPFLDLPERRLDGALHAPFQLLARGGSDDATGALLQPAHLPLEARKDLGRLLRQSLLRDLDALVPLSLRERQFALPFVSGRPTLRLLDPRPCPAVGLFGLRARRPDRSQAALFPGTHLRLRRRRRAEDRPQLLPGRTAIPHPPLRDRTHCRG